MKKLISLGLVTVATLAFGAVSFAADRPTYNCMVEGCTQVHYAGSKAHGACAGNGNCAFVDANGDGICDNAANHTAHQGKGHGTANGKGHGKGHGKHK